MWIEVRKGKRSTKFRCHVDKIHARTGVAVRSTKIFELRSDALKWGRHVENALERGIYVDTRPVDSQKLAKYIEKYIERLTPDFGTMASKVGWKQEVHRLNAWLKNPLSSRALSKVTYLDMIEYISHRRRDHSKRIKQGAEPRFVAEQTIKHELIAISNTYEFARIYYQLEGLVNPVQGIPKAMRPGASREVDVRITPEIWKKLEPLLKSRKQKMYVLATELAIETAMRRGELLRLAHKDIRPTPSDCTYVIATDFRQEGGRVVAHVRKIPLSTRAKEIIRQILALSDKQKLEESPTIWGKTSAGGLSKAFREDCVTLGIKDSTGVAATFHATRHEACTRMVNAGIPINTLAKITGHKLVSQLQRYFNPSVSDLLATIQIKDKAEMSKRSQEKSSALACEPQKDDILNSQNRKKLGEFLPINYQTGRGKYAD